MRKRERERERRAARRDRHNLLDVGIWGNFFVMKPQSSELRIDRLSFADCTRAYIPYNK